MTWEVVSLVRLPLEDLQPLLIEGRQQGFEFLDRLVETYSSGVNRFDRPGEALFAIYDRDGLIAIGGLNRDPYIKDGRTGRVRHLYVLSHYRRQGVATAIMARIVAEAQRNFRRLTLRTFTVDADRFYRALGFQTEPQLEGATHYLSLSDDEK